MNYAFKCKRQKNRSHFVLLGCCLITLRLKLPEFNKDIFPSVCNYYNNINSSIRICWCGLLIIWQLSRVVPALSCPGSFRRRCSLSRRESSCFLCAWILLHVSDMMKGILLTQESTTDTNRYVNSNQNCNWIILFFEKNNNRGGNVWYLIIEAPCSVWNKGSACNCFVRYKLKAEICHYYVNSIPKQ